MKPLRNAPRSIHSTIAAALVLGIGSAACSSSSGDSQKFVLRSTNHAVAFTTPIEISERWLAYLADEAITGNPATMDPFTNLNGDMDVAPIDQVAVVINMFTLEENVLEVAVDSATEKPLVWVGDQLYIVCDETEDERNWNASTGDMDTNDLVLLNWSRAAGQGFLGVEYVDDLDPSHELKFVAVGDQLFYASATVPVGAGMSNISSVCTSAPLAPIPLMTTDAVNPLVIEILGADEGMVFLLIDENEQTPAFSLNGDADFTDHILALLDGTLDAPNGLIQSTDLALADDSGPFRAMNKAANDWMVGFFVSESDQGTVSLNDRNDFAGGWALSQCGVTRDDTDTNDDVLHFLHYALWSADPVMDPPRSTGLAGEERIVAAPGYLGTICPENRDGEASGGGACSLNGDGDSSDKVVRWVTAPESQMTSVLVPGAGEGQFRALEDVDGGTHGLVEFDGRWVMVVNEADDGVDYFDAGDDLELVGWIDPGGFLPWRFDHVSGAFAGATWMAEQPDGEVLVALPEDVNDVSLNASGGDADTNDSIPTVLNFALGPLLQFGGVGVAVDEDNAGVAFEKGLLFYRADENADGRDWNGDGDTSDFVLLRSANSVTATPMATLNNLPRPAICTDPDDSPSAGVFLTRESDEGAGVDFNGDGDTGDLVVRYFLF